MNSSIISNISIEFFLSVTLHIGHSFILNGPGRNLLVRFCFFEFCFSRSMNLGSLGVLLAEKMLMMIDRSMANQTSNALRVAYLTLKQRKTDQSLTMLATNLTFEQTFFLAHAQTQCYQRRFDLQTDKSSLNTMLFQMSEFKYSSILFRFSNSSIIFIVSNKCVFVVLMNEISHRSIHFKIKIVVWICRSRANERSLFNYLVDASNSNDRKRMKYCFLPSYVKQMSD